MGEVGLRLERQENETWKEAAMRVARAHGLEGEVDEEFKKHIEEGKSEEQAAWCACYDWDLLDVAFVGSSNRPPPSGGDGTSDDTG